MKIKNWKKFNESVVGSYRNQFVQNINLGKIYRFANVDSTEDTNFLPIGSFHSMQTTLKELNINYDPNIQGVVHNIVIPNETDGYYIFYTKFDGENFTGDEKLVNTEYIINKTKTPTNKLIKDIEGQWEAFRYHQ